MLGTARERWLAIWIDYELGDLSDQRMEELYGTISKHFSEEDKVILRFVKIFISLGFQRNGIYEELILKHFTCNTNFRSWLGV